MTFFLDTSAIVKRYVNESGSDWVNGLFELKSRTGRLLFISQLTVVELPAAIYARARQAPKELPQARADHLLAWFAREVRRKLQLVEIGSPLVGRAAAQCRNHPLRADDAMQLACALIIAEEARAIKSDQPIFMCSDNSLITAAKTEGLLTGNPLDHL